MIPEDASDGLSELYEMASGAAGSYTLTEYLNDVNRENTEVLAEIGMDGAVKKAYTYGEQRLSVDETGKDGSASSFYLYDARGSVSALSQKGGTLLESYQYDPFGRITFGAPADVNVYGYNAESYNKTTGLLYLRARHYDTETGRFLTEDGYLGTLGNPMSRNRYAYGEGNPLGNVDPSGHSIISTFAKTVKNTVEKMVRNQQANQRREQMLMKQAARTNPEAVAQAIGRKVANSAKKVVGTIAESTAKKAVQAVSDWEKAKKKQDARFREEKFCGKWGGAYYWDGYEVPEADYIERAACERRKEVAPQKNKEIVAGVTLSLLDTVAGIDSLVLTAWDQVFGTDQARKFQYNYQNLTGTYRYNTDAYKVFYIGTSIAQIGAGTVKSAGSLWNLMGQGVSGGGMAFAIEGVGSLAGSSAWSLTEVADLVGSSLVSGVAFADAQNGGGGERDSNTLTDAQKSRLNTLENTINDHLTEGDFSGTLRDLQGNPVPDGRGGYFDHLGEMKDSYKSLQKVKGGLEGSLKNPNLSGVDRTLLQEGLDKANAYISKIEELFKPFGGIN